MCGCFATNYTYIFDSKCVQILHLFMLKQEYSPRLWDTLAARHSLLHIISESKAKKYFSQMFRKLKSITLFKLLQFSQLIATRIAPMQLHQQNVQLPNIPLQNVQDTKRPGYKTSRIQNVEVCCLFTILQQTFTNKLANSALPL